LSEKRNSFLRLLKNKAFKEESRTKNGVYAIGEFTTLESNKSHFDKLSGGGWVVDCLSRQAYNVCVIMVPCER
jgi:hypothetical protein